MRKSVLQILVLSLAAMPLLSMDEGVAHDADQMAAHAQPSPVLSRLPLTLDELRALTNTEEMRKAQAAMEKYMNMYYPQPREEIRHPKPY